MLRSVCLVSLLSLLLAGCGGSGYAVSTVEGKVMVDGTPIPTGTLSFSPLESNAGVPISADIQDGKYRSDKVPRGRSLVHINAFVDTGEKIMELGVAYPKMKNLVPDKYLGGIEVNVDAPQFTHDFDLKTN